MDYADYLRSDHWKQLAAETRRLAGNRCQVCNSDGELHAHHRTYERKGDEFQGDLICLCQNCHAVFHKLKLNPEYLETLIRNNLRLSKLLEFLALAEIPVGTSSLVLEIVGDGK